MYTDKGSILMRNYREVYAHTSNHFENVTKNRVDLH